MKRVIVSGGGTGGHIYPAVAVAEALRRRFGEEVEILFVGAEGKMEMEKVPALGYRIVGLPVAGLQRRFDLKNLAVPFKVLKSIRKARRTIRDFGADVVVGFGGYASGPVLWAAQTEQSAVLYLPQSGDVTECLVGSVKCTGVQSKAISELEHPIHTLILLDNSLSIPKESRVV